MTWEGPHSEMMQVVVIGGEEGQESREVNTWISDHLNMMPLFYYFISVQPHNIPMGKEDIKSRKGNWGSQWVQWLSQSHTADLSLTPFLCCCFYADKSRVHWQARFHQWNLFWKSRVGETEAEKPTGASWIRQSVDHPNEAATVEMTRRNKVRRGHKDRLDELG